MLTRLRPSILLAIMLILAIVPVTWAYTQSPPALETPEVPENLAVPQQNVLAFTAFARGVQVYACAPRPDDPSVFVWTFKAPDAALLNDAGERIGAHYAGPVWESADGSMVQGKVLGRADAPSSTAIPWLLLEATPQGSSGVFSNVTYIQRLDTVGGIAPTDGCDQAAAGAERGVPYTAVYAFYQAYNAEI